jgi:hypothetical protein
MGKLFIDRRIPEVNWKKVDQNSLCIMSFMNCERMQRQEWDEGEIELALRKAYELDNWDLDEESLMGINFEVITFTSRRAFGKPRRCPKTVILVRRREGNGKFTEYVPGEFNSRIDDMAGDLRDDLPAGADAYDEMVEWIGDKVRRAQGF